MNASLTNRKVSFVLTFLVVLVLSLLGGLGPADNGLEGLGGKPTGSLAPTSESQQITLNKDPKDGSQAVLAESNQQFDGMYRVVRVVDGDTIVVEESESKKEETVRLIGVDSPESRHPRKPLECFGKEAGAYVQGLINKGGFQVALVADDTQANRDVYGRLLRYVYLADGTFVNKEIIRQGYAHEYTYKDTPYVYQKEFIEAQMEARISKSGLWADDACADFVKLTAAQN